MEDIIFSPMFSDAIGEIMNISLGSSATAASNMLDHRVDITTPTVQIINAEEFSLGRIEPAVGVEIKYVCGLEGSNIMMLKRGDVKAIVDILLGTETPDEEFELNDLAISAVRHSRHRRLNGSRNYVLTLMWTAHKTYPETQRCGMPALISPTHFSTAGSYRKAFRQASARLWLSISAVCILSATAIIRHRPKQHSP